MTAPVEILPHTAAELEALWADTFVVRVEAFAGLDLGQAGDYTCLTLWERVVREHKPHETKTVPREVWSDPVRLEEWLNEDKRPKPKPPPAHWHGKIIMRFDVHTPYPDIVDRVKAGFEREEYKDRNPALVVDGTGVGRAVTDMFRRANMKCRLVPVQITAGHAPAKPDEYGYWNVPKSELVASANMLLQTRRVNVDDDCEHAGLLLKELRAFRIKQTKTTGAETFEAWREKDHDDMVLASALAFWWGERARQQIWVK